MGSAHPDEHRDSWFVSRLSTTALMIEQNFLAAEDRPTHDFNGRALVLLPGVGQHLEEFFASRPGWESGITRSDTLRR